MRYSEVARDAPKFASHPYEAHIEIDPADYRRLTRLIDERPELRCITVDDRQADRWTVTVGCASRRVRDDLHDWVGDAF